MRKIFLLLSFLSVQSFAQNTLSNEFTFNEFLGYVKKNHPLVKNAQLEINKAQANLMMARGAFDPKIGVDFDTKQFKNKNYYSMLNSSFKIPTWYGIEFKAGLDQSQGYNLNPENGLPSGGLAAFGINIPLGQGLLINSRMADLQKAKIQLKLSDAERKIEAIQVLYQAAISYYNWKKTHGELVLYQNYLTNAKTRFEGVRNLIKQGDKPAIDSVEVGIALQNRLLSVEDSKLKLNKARLELSNFLWLDDNIPMEIAPEMIPENNLEQNIEATLKINQLFEEGDFVSRHPKINAWQNKIEMLTIDKKLKSNLLLPKIDLGYNYIAEPNYFNNFRFEDYKIAINFSMPIFLRKERAGVKLAQLKIQESKSLLALEKLQLTNKVTAQRIEIESYKKQLKMVSNLAESNLLMLKSEERLFMIGESSMFLVNTRENNLVSAQLNKIALENKYFTSMADLFKVMVNVE
ncbi:MAG: TolC family protein [Sphingobacteriaceae bacterium]|nr:TolC family protein [Sphingobacteriaceae bacterium]